MNVRIEESWRRCLQPEFDSPYFAELAEFVRHEYASCTVYPPARRIFHAFDSCPFDRVRAVIIGQDPYHEPDVYKRQSDMYPTFASSMRYGFFQVVSVSSTTGFATADSSVWTPLAIMVLTLFTMQCACAGSTAGGIKCDRVLLAFKTIRAMMIRRQHPNAVIRVKLNGVIQEQSVVDMAMLFIVFYLMLLALGTICLLYTSRCV